MYTTTTDLGRRVALDDWKAAHGDRIVAMLSQMRDLGTATLAVKDLKNASGLSPENVDEVVEQLMANGLVTLDAGDVLQLTILGELWARPVCHCECGRR